ncbi:MULTISPECIES: NAD(P)/FAD-dependent oxidoreductase [Mesorhizobium]|uniref:Trimethylamine monooxygenase n=1 Tax=Mesorhizobium abyssinicae TaxID=1209958 RepID=A0ABU5ATM3_9HYPH|nr:MULTISPECIES: NAD(P)/FAD-dependent oxidoreductase [Mesorhizobium]RVC57298.1 NAD(P)/FAD-dependent oxidoreductase [Mesorhizobium sp. M4B.F.Ca.ET.088.02.2.1]MDX8540652.1 NAD(P)/FAD-dependent oxidoreductase [Mesorhizobium abyssinicae]RUW21081.1 NAD(P)/FAD-dependent oxidoreductase [Mesorhizobium sp. M4B.F.Ca.ET.013.02.1.1]RVD14746.1 NAD(P)/FAD-dependent oxidoreductase [Mesorhizobium sp. M4B.F.Ca.ET.017.02.2.1]RVD41241.1 NAD(P)/FAD-dependent oxidoreductase [Mesorhizobium sp. M4B.F.Ca.ET.019.03.1.
MDTNVVIVGAGPAGLAVGACLRRAGVDFLMLEKASEVAPAWRRHYRRLHLHTVKSFSSLPFVPFPSDHPRYVPREKVVAYLDAYAERFELRPRFGVTVDSIRRDKDGFRVETGSDALTARHVVVASGNNAEPIVPSFPGIETFKGKVLHSADYTEAAPFFGRTVLVIGMGNTGAEIALDLAESGAHPTLSVRKGVHIVPRQLFGVPIQMVGIATRPMPQGLNDRMFPIILDLALGKLEKYGIVRPKEGILKQIDAGRIPVIDVGTVAAIKAGRIKVAPDVKHFGERGATFVDGGQEEFDAVILATGYRPAYDNFLPAELRPQKSGVNARSSELGLYLVGFHNPVTGLLREIGLEAMAVAADIEKRG